MIARRSMKLADRFARSSAEGTMNSLVRITRPGEATYDEETREYGPGLQLLIYSDPLDPAKGGIAGITPAQGPITMELGDEPQYYSSVTVYLPQSAPKNPRINDIVEVLGSPDGDMVGRRFRVVDVPAGGRITASIALQCTGIAPSREWLADDA